MQCSSDIVVVAVVVGAVSFIAVVVAVKDAEQGPDVKVETRIDLAADAMQ